MRRAVASLDCLGLWPMSGITRPRRCLGMLRHRVGIACVLMVDVDLLLADEPRAHLDEGLVR
ncbi:hypothetical protein ACFWB0_06060 [Rhodococcus sp. NPDC060086]|uniref:hypothetical protein n=1 Tax=Rhodococcus sp. NPDC060086 TaxID=3347055 RepID=UPI00365A3051